MKNKYETQDDNNRLMPTRVSISGYVEKEYPFDVYDRNNLDKLPLKENGIFIQGVKRDLKNYCRIGYVTRNSPKDWSKLLNEFECIGFCACDKIDIDLSKCIQGIEAYKKSSLEMRTNEIEMPNQVILIGYVKQDFLFEVYDKKNLKELLLEEKGIFILGDCNYLRKYHSIYYAEEHFSNYFPLENSTEFDCIGFYECNKNGKELSDIVNGIEKYKEIGALATWGQKPKLREKWVTK